MSDSRKPTPPSAERGGEPANQIEKKCPPAKELEGEILEVHFQSGIKVAYTKSTVKSPHWKKGENVNDGRGSNRPAVYLVEPRGASHNLMVKVKITKSKNVSSPGELSARLGTLKFTGKCPTTTGEHNVNCKIDMLPDSIQWYQGDTTWMLKVQADAMSVALKNQPRMEVFVVLDTPMSYYQGAKGVWTEALRFLCGRVGLVGKKTHEEVAKAVTQYCHTSHGLKYDTASGAPAYGCSGSGGTFQLDSYIKAASTVVNCYDQAAAVQSLSGAVGTSISWLYLSPFGFISTTNLIGVGSCNNPFFDSNGSLKVVGTNDPSRTPFGNHAFGEFSAKTYDACAGPHVGTESRAQYISNSIDTTTTLYSSFASFRPGTTADITTPGGVASVA